MTKSGQFRTPSCTRKNQRPTRFQLLSCAVFLLGSFLFAAVGHAQIYLDGSMGTVGALAGPNFVIPSTVGQTRGANLFHSFKEFNIQQGQSATFSGPSSINNIFSRVTGRQESTINGLLKSEIAGANFYLINPAGIFFGPFAQLDVGGSFHVSTADYLRFADGAKFHADLSKQSILTTAPVAAFGFLVPKPVGITINQSGNTSVKLNFRVQPGQTMSLIGGDIDIVGSPRTINTEGKEATVFAPSGAVNLVSVASSGEVTLSTSGQTSEIGLVDFTQLGSVRLSNGALISTSTEPIDGRGNGTIIVRANNLSLTGNSALFADTRADADGSAIGIDIDLAGALSVADRSRITSEIDVKEGEASSMGSAGNVLIKANQVDVTGGIIASRLFPNTTGAGANVEITTNTLTVNNAGRISTESGGLGTPGVLRITAENLSVLNDGAITSSTSGNGKGGAVDVRARDNVTVAGGNILASNVSSGIGQAGEVSIDTSTLSITGGGRIATNSSGRGPGGAVTITTGKSVHISGTSTAGMISGISSDSTGDGDAGQIIITSPLVAMDGGSLTAKTTRLGAGGTIELNVKDTRLTNNSEISSSTFALGRGGTIRFNNAESISLDHSSILSTSELTSRNQAGEIFIETKRLALSNGAQVATNTLGLGGGGTVEVTASDTVRLRNSTMLASTSNSGAGGTINLAAPNMEIIEGGAISTVSSGTSAEIGAAPGSAGNINLLIGALRMDDGRITTAAAEAAGGNITIRHTGSTLRLNNSQITTSVNGGDGKGGNITIGAELDNNLKLVKVNPFDFVILNNSNISANAFKGDGGNINIAANVFLTSPTTSITASSALGAPGSVDIQAPTTDLSGSLAPLPDAIVQATSLLRQSCAARYADGKRSTLGFGSRGRLPWEPGNMFYSSNYLPPASGENPVVSFWRSQGYGGVGFGKLFEPRLFSINEPCKG